jgi:hypothetical protein
LPVARRKSVHNTQGINPLPHHYDQGYTAVTGA